MDVLLLALTLAPGLAIILFVYLRDKYDKEPFRQLFLAFFFGVISTALAVLLGNVIERVTHFTNKGNIVDIFYYAYGVVAVSEELAKYIFLFYFIRKPFFDEPYDGITYAVVIAMGFATLENVLYVYGDGTGNYTTALLRMLTAVPGHASFAVVMGYCVGLAKFNPGRQVFFTLLGISGAIVFHGTYDFLLMQQDYPYIALGAFVALIISLWLSFRAIRIHRINSPFNPANNSPIH